MIIRLIIINYTDNYIYKNLFIHNLLKNIHKNKLDNIDFFNVSMYKSEYERNNFMIIIKPQNYHFFIESEKFIYHPKNKHLDGILKQYYCNKGFELAYTLPINDNTSFPIPKVICHKKLKYLKANIYKPENILVYKSFYDLQNPFTAINEGLKDFIYPTKQPIL